MRLACSRFWDSGNGTKICAQEKQRREGRGGPPSPSPYLPPYFFPAALWICATLYCLNAWKRLWPQTKIVGVKDALLPLQTTSTAEKKLNCVSQVCNKLAGEIAQEIGVKTAILFWNLRMENAYQQKQRMTLLLRMRDVRKRSRGEWLVFPVLDSATPCRHLSRAFLKKSEVTGAEFFSANFIRIRWASSKRFWTTSHLADSGSALKWQRNDNNNFCYYHYSNNRDFRQRRLWAMHVNRKTSLYFLQLIFGCGLALMFGQVVGSITAKTSGITNLVASRYTYIKRKTPHFQLTCII